ncbi:MAG: hypothetical protein AAGA56_30050, partial [Myxococcota bacterium]
VTRAREHLALRRAAQRPARGTMRNRPPSRILAALPAAQRAPVDMIAPPKPTADALKAGADGVLAALLGKTGG